MKLKKICAITTCTNYFRKTHDPYTEKKLNALKAHLPQSVFTSPLNAATFFSSSHIGESFIYILVLNQTGPKPTLNFLALPYYIDCTSVPEDIFQKALDAFNAVKSGKNIQATQDSASAAPPKLKILKSKTKLPGETFKNHHDQILADPTPSTVLLAAGEIIQLEPATYKYNHLSGRYQPDAKQVQRLMPLVFNEYHVTGFFSESPLFDGG